MARVDDERIRRIVLDAIGHYECIAQARENGLYVVRQRDEVIELAMPLAPKLARRLVRVPWTSRVHYEDLEQAACEGIIEGVDSFDPRRTYFKKDGSEHLVKPSSHLFWRVRKRVFMEVQDTHWLLAKPSREDVEAYMKGLMNEADRRAYVNAVLRPIDDADRAFSHGITPGHSPDGMTAAAYAHREAMQR